MTLAQAISLAAAALPRFPSQRERLSRTMGFMRHSRALCLGAIFSWLALAPAWIGAAKTPRRAGIARQASLTWRWEDKLGEGSFNEAYMAEVEGTGDYYGFNPGQKLVLKFIKAKKYNSGVRITEKDVAAQKLAQQYAKAFKEKHRPVRGKEPLDLFFRIGTLISSSKDQLDGTVKKILEDELIQVELPIYGEFKKFNSNTGWSSGEGNLPGAFSHWTWVESNGKHLICDLQGHRGLPGGTKTTDGSSNYAFSDPAVLSKVSGSYGPADLGEEGQKTWFSHHVCNDFCKSLGLEGKVPKCQQAHHARQIHTVYRPIR